MRLFFILFLFSTSTAIKIPKFFDELIPKGVSFTSMRELPSASKIKFPTTGVLALQEKKFMEARDIQNSIVACTRTLKIGAIRLKHLGKRLLESPSLADKGRIKMMIAKTTAMMTKTTADLVKEKARLTKLIASTPTPMKPLIAAGVAMQTARQVQAKAYYHGKFKPLLENRKAKIEKKIRDVKEAAKSKHSSEIVSNKPLKLKKISEELERDEPDRDKPDRDEPYERISKDELARNEPSKDKYSEKSYEDEFERNEHYEKISEDELARNESERTEPERTEPDKYDNEY